MIERDADHGPEYYDSDENALLASASLFLRWRRTIIALGVLGAALGLASGLLSTRVYKSSATFIPQGSEGSNAGVVALAASQFGIRLPTSTGAWGPSVYVEMLRSRALLEPIAFDTLVIAEEGGRRAVLMDLLEIEAPTMPRRIELTVDALRGMISSSDQNRFGAVEVDVTSRWPSVSGALAKRLIQRVSEFNLQTRKSQAAAERQFVEIQAREAERALREAEDRLQLFLQRNRAMGGSPELAFERDRLQREVTLRQNLFTSWLQSREEARIREVRDTPVITVLEDPQVPFVGEARGTVRKTIFGGTLGVMIGVLIAYLSRWLVGARGKPSEEAREFFQLVEEATPRFLRKDKS